MKLPLLNLLPPERRSEFDEALLFSAIRRSLILVGVVFGCAIALFLAASFVLDREIQAQQKITADSLEKVTATGDASLDDQIRKFNATLTSVNNLQKNYTQWTPILHDFFSLLPSGITLTQVEIDGKGLILLARGNASDRDALLAFQEAITSSTRFHEPTSPLSNLLQRKNIAFEMRMNLTLP